MRVLGALAVLLSGAAAAEEAPQGEPPKAEGSKPQSSVVVALLDLEANRAAAEAAPGVTSLLASRLSESPEVRLIAHRDITVALGVERQRQLLGGDCSAAECMTELSGALGARYLVSGRLDRFGSRYVLAATVFDSQAAVALAKPSAEASDAEALPHVAGQVAVDILRALGAQGLAAEAGHSTELSLGLKVGSQFLAQLAALSPGGKLELAVRFHPEWAGFLQIGFSLLKAEQDDKLADLRLVPSMIGARKLYRVEHRVQPYWGFALGLQLSIGEWGVISGTQSLPTVIGLFGCQFMFSKKLGAVLEASSNLAQMVLGLRHEGLGAGLNFDVSAGVQYHF